MTKDDTAERLDRIIERLRRWSDALAGAVYPSSKMLQDLAAEVEAVKVEIRKR